MGIVLPAPRSEVEQPEPPDSDFSASLGAIGKAMLVLGCVGGHGVPIKLSEIARHTKLAKSTVHRLLAVLEAHGAVKRWSSGYALGEMMRQLADGVESPRRTGLRRVLMPHLAELYEATHLSVSLAVLHDLTVAYLVTIYPRALTGPIMRTSERAPVHCTAPGKLLLAFDPTAPPFPSGDRWLTRLAPNTITNRRRLESELAHIRREGIAYSRQEYVAGMVGVAVPVVDRFNGAIAIGVAGPAEDLNLAEVEPLLRQSAYAASMTLKRYRNPACAP